MIQRALIGFLSSMTLMGGALASPVVTPSDRVTHNVVIRPAPGSSVKMDALDPGEKVDLLDQIPGWYHIRLNDGRTGYVSKSWTVVADTGPAIASAGGPVKVHVIDVGTGLGIFIEGPGFALVYDAGSQDDLADGSSNRVVSYIKAVRPDLHVIDHVILSHPHKDHLELMPDVFKTYTVKNVWDSGTVNKTRGYCRFLKAVAAMPGVQYHDAIESGGTHSVTFGGSDCSGTVSIPEAGMMTDQPVALAGGASLNFLYRHAEHHADPNENSVVVRLDYGSHRLLLVGDAEGGERKPPGEAPDPTSIEGDLLAHNPAGIKADVLIVGHHGSITSSRSAFIDAVGAKIFVISSGPYPYKSVRLPDHEIEDELRSNGRTLFETTVHDANDECARDEAKIGPDADESPGGCDNVLVVIPGTGPISANYNHISE